MEWLGVDAYRSPEWDKYVERSSCPEDAPPLNKTFTQCMELKVRSEPGRAHYGCRKCTVRPVIGRIK